MACWNFFCHAFKFLKHFCLTAALLERLVLVLGLVLHHHLAALAHGEGEGALDVLGIAQLVHVLPENLGQVGRHLLVERYLHQLGRGKGGGGIRDWD